MTFSFHPAAEAEFNKAIDYYEEIESGPGFDFTIEVYFAIQRSHTFPKAWPIIEGNPSRTQFPKYYDANISNNSFHFLISISKKPALSGLFLFRWFRRGRV